MFTKTIIKVFQFGLPTNLPTDTKIKITKLLAISPIVHSINQLGKWDGLLVLIHTTQIVKRKKLKTFKKFLKISLKKKKIFK